MNESGNPYQSPSANSKLHDGACVFNDKPVIARCESLYWYSRSIVLTGGLNGKVEYRAAGLGEKVLVNGKLVEHTSAFNTPAYVVAPRADFVIPTDRGPVAAHIDVYAAWLQLFRIIRFSLTVNGALVYSDQGSR